jgi:predicted transcriptional regulator
MSFVKKAYDLSRKQVYFCNRSDTLDKVARIMHLNNIGSILVGNNEEVHGIITSNDLLRQIAINSNQKETTANDIMSSPVIKISKNMEIDNLYEHFNKHKVSRLILTNDSDKIVGVVRDIAVFKCMSFNKFDTEARNRFANDYVRKLY